MKRKLNVGLLVDGNNVAAWQYKLIDQINKSSYADIALIIENEKKEESNSTLNWIINNFTQIVFLIFSKIDRKIFSFKPDAFQNMNLTDLEMSSQRIKIEPIRGKHIDRVKKTDIDKIKDFNLDVLIRFGFRILKGEILSVSKYGVWSYHHGDNKFFRGKPAGLWEFLMNKESTGVILQILNEKLDDGKLLCKSQTITNQNSLNRGRNYNYWKAVSFIPRELKKLHSLGGDKFFENVESLNSEPSFYSEPLYTNPRNISLLIKLIFKYFSILINKFYELFYFNQWVILYRINKTAVISKSFFQFKKLTPPKGKFWADPFVAFEENKYFIFLEEYDDSLKKGHISVIEMSELGVASVPKIVLTKDYHLSYPFILKDNGKWFMIPETKSNNSIELYECIDFPYKWEFKKNLFTDVKAVDTTILKEDNTYWLFTNIQENDGSIINDELFLYYSDDLVTDKWTAHPQNPIVSDVRSARSAGNIFRYNNNLYRPSQINTPRYGYGMNINKVIKLDKNNYEEQIVDVIIPNWDKNLIATHTLNFEKKLTIVDGLYKRNKFKI